MQTIITFLTAHNPHNIYTDYAGFAAHSAKHLKTHVVRGKWDADKAIARAKRYGALDGTIVVKHAKIYAAKEWQRFSEVVANA